MIRTSTIDGKAAYHTPTLRLFGPLSAVTLSGNGTMVEFRSNMVTCSGYMFTPFAAMDQRYPCA